MKRSCARFTIPVLCSILPCVQALSQGAGDILSLTPDRLLPANPVNNGHTTQFGSAIGLDGDVMVIGAPSEDSSVTPGDTNTGAVYVFEREGGIWTEQQALRAPIEIAGENFGAAVDVALGSQGVDFLIVGAPGYAAGQGRIYLYRRDVGGPWVLESALNQWDPSNADIFGTAVAIDFFIPPNTTTGTPVFAAVVGAPQNSGPFPGGSQNGSISILQRGGGPPTWGVTHEFFGENSDALGSAVAMSGPMVVAGSQWSNGSGLNAGGGRYYSMENFTGVIFHYAEGLSLDPSDPQLGAAGVGLAASVHHDTGFLGSIGVLGAPLHDQGAANAGMVYVFDLATTGSPSLNEIAMIQPPGLISGARFGTSVTLSGPIMAVGAPGIQPSGAVYLFDRGASAAEWNLAGYLSPPSLPPPGNCYFGQGISLQGQAIATGCAASSYLDEGVYIYEGDGIFADGFESGDGSAWN